MKRSEGTLPPREGAHVSLRRPLSEGWPATLYPTITNTTQRPPPGAQSPWGQPRSGSACNRRHTFQGSLSKEPPEETTRSFQRVNGTAPKVSGSVPFPSIPKLKFFELGKTVGISAFTTNLRCPGGGKITGFPNQWLFGY